MSPRETGDSVTADDRNDVHSLSVTRRRFLKRGAAVGAGVVAVYLAPSFTSVTASPAYASITGTSTPTPATTPTPTTLEIDVFSNVEWEFQLILPTGEVTTVLVGGTATVEVLIGSIGETPDPPGSNGLDQVQTEIVAMNLSGTSPVLGPVGLALNPSISSQGEIEEQANSTAGILDVPPFKPSGSADSFFDVFVEIDLSIGRLHNVSPYRVAGPITHKPPAEGEGLSSIEDVALYDENGNPTGFHLAAGSLVFNAGPA